jgi:hypothetical protein
MTPIEAPAAFAAVVRTLVRDHLTAKTAHTAETAETAKAEETTA